MDLDWPATIFQEGRLEFAGEHERTLKFDQSEIFSPPNADVAAQYDITYDESAHGTEGRIHASYSPWIWPSTGRQIPEILVHSIFY